MEEHWSTVDDHLSDLRKALLRSVVIIIAGFFIVLGFYQPILQFLTNEYHSFTFSSSPLLILGPIEGFSIVCKVCFWLSVLVTSPGWGWVWLQFVLPAMRPGEKQLLIPFIFLSGLFSFLGIVFAHYFTLPAATHYFILFNESIGQNAWTLAHYIDYTFILYTGHAVGAEFALIFLLLVHFGVVQTQWLVKKRRVMVIAAFVLGALLTPPDVITQLFLAIPIILLYEIAIFYSRWKKA